MDRFELTVQRRVNGAWPVVAVGQPGDGSPPVRTEGRMRLDPAGLTTVDARAYGAALGRALFADDVALAFARAQAAAAERLHVLLSVEDGEIKSYRWERL